MIKYLTLSPSLNTGASSAIIPSVHCIAALVIRVMQHNDPACTSRTDSSHANSYGRVVVTSKYEIKYAITKFHTMHD